LGEFRAPTRARPALRYYDGVDTIQRFKDFRPPPFRHQGSPYAFQFTNTVIGIDRDDQFAAKSFGGTEIAHVADMQKIKAAVGESNLFAGAPPSICEADQFVSGHDLVGIRCQ